MHSIQDGGYTRSFSMAFPEDVVPSYYFPEEVLFLIFDQLEELNRFPRVCKHWDRVHKLYIYNVQKSPISSKHVTLFNDYGKELTCLNMQNHFDLKDENLIEIFSKCKNLCHVNISSKFITNTAFHKISTTLRSLSLNCVEVTHTIFKILPKFSSFQSLTLTTHKMKSLIHLPKLSSLTSLKMNVSVSHCNEQGFEHMTGLKSLKELDIMFDRQDKRRIKEPPLAPNQDYIAPLTSLTALEKITFYFRDFEDNESFIQELIPFTQLKTLQLHGSVSTYSVGFDLSLLSQLTHLETLSLKRFKFNEYKEVNHIYNLKNLSFLKGLELSYICIVGHGKQFNLALQSLPDLKYLKLKAFTYMFKKIYEVSDFNDISDDWDIQIIEPSQNWIDPF